MSRNKAENCRNEVKSYITREGMTMTEVVELLADEHGWSSSVPNLSGKLRRGSLRYTEAVELADVLGYDLVWQKRLEVRQYRWNDWRTAEKISTDTAQTR